LEEVECEFENIETLIKSAVSSTTKTNGSLAAHLARARKAVAEERNRIKKHFVFQALSFDNKQQTKLYVRYHQHYLTNLIDELFEFAQSLDKKNKTKSNLSLEIFFFYDQLEDLLTFIKDEFPECFAENSKLTKPQRNEFANKINQRFSRLKNALCKLDQTLVSVCTSPIHHILADPCSEMTSQKVHFIETLLNEIEKIVTTNSAEAAFEDCVRALLLRLNYNDETVFVYYTEFIKAGLSESDCVVGQLEKLAFYYKLINQSQSIPGFIYDPKFPPICERLSGWILEEIQYLEKRRQLLRAPSSKDEPFIRDDFKLEVDISVSQLACLIKVFIEAGIIQNKNISELIRFLSKFVKTKKSESFSNESFRIKYYNVESNTKRAVRNLFHTVISYINSN
jgi:hypothetical protein